MQYKDKIIHNSTIFFIFFRGPAGLHLIINFNAK
jgi:hypothetical protein